MNYYDLSYGFGLIGLWFNRTITCITRAEVLTYILSMLKKLKSWSYSMAEIDEVHIEALMFIQT